jgi:hypothetical protein
MRRIFISLLLILSFWVPCEAQEKKKIAYGLFVDNTGSMRTQFDEVIRIGKGVVHQIHDRGPVSIFDFHSDGKGPDARSVPIMRIEQVQDEADLSDTLDDLYVEGGQTTLLDAIQALADHLKEKAESSDKVIILITDGEERKSSVRQKELLQKLSELKVRVYAVGLVEQLGSHRGKAVDFLRDLTKGTGGKAVFAQRGDNLQTLLDGLALPIQ